MGGRWNRREALGLAGGMGALLAAPDLMAAVANADGHAPDRLWYAQPAKQWVEALPVGNGRIGAMVFGDIAHERIQLNEDTLWGGGPYDPVNPEAPGALPEMRRKIFAGDYAGATALAKDSIMAVPLRQMSYQALGDLFLDMEGIDPNGVTQYRRQLDIDAALSSVRFVAGEVTYTRDVVASPGDHVIAIHLSADKKGEISFDLHATTPQKDGKIFVANDGALLVAGRNNMDNGVAGALRFEARIIVLHEGGALSHGADRLTLRGANEATILIAMATSYRRFDDVSGDPSALNLATMQRMSAKSFARIASDTAKAHQALFRRVRINLGNGHEAEEPTDLRIRRSEKYDDPTLAALYFQYGRYLLICSSRPGSQPANLQGIWNESTRPPWGSKYTVNINTQMNYWPAEPTALPETTEPLIAMVRDLAVTGARTAQTMYGARGWVCHHNTDLWRATAPIDGPQYGIWPTGGAWLCLHLWDRFDYGRDPAYLASIYPILKGASLFFLDTLVKDPKSGWMVTNPSLSPENNHGHGTSLCAGPTMDMQIIRDLFTHTAAAARLLATDPDLVSQIDTMRTQLAPSRIGSQGQLMEWQEDWDANAGDIHHRHVSHLYGLYPSAQISHDDTPDLAAAARRSLEIRGDKATGWATAWRINLWARLRDGDRAHSILRFLLGPERTYPNMFDAHPPFQIDGNFGGAAGIAEMLMQSVGERLWLLPALPKAWPKGSIYGLRARGRMQVDVEWNEGRLVRARLTPSLDGSRDVRCGDRMKRIAFKAGRAMTLRLSDFD